MEEEAGTRLVEEEGIGMATPKRKRKQEEEGTTVGGGTETEETPMKRRCIETRQKQEEEQHDTLGAAGQPKPASSTRKLGWLKPPTEAQDPRRRRRPW